MKKLKSPSRIIAANKAHNTIRHQKIDRTAAALKAHSTRKMIVRNNEVIGV
jgi:hypothetical protein